MDTHSELQVMEQGSYAGGSLIASNPEDKNISRNYKIPGKNVIERKCLAERADNLRDFLLDVVEVRSTEVLEDMPIDKVLHYALKAAVPQMVHTKNEHSFSFADMAKRAYDNSDEVIDIDAK